ncbi:histone acetyltransferase KAT7-like isoform X1 [Pieris brassicae]|uniref:histone acetyltransferase KAT7-like isoform X1 n=1 Tax=Pieris brassicae TaxID=7116 RepID=UPI001E65EE2A|nr:histone acetyltransferase KAT7-like isoform X1 [Pieris brassicae]
MKKPEVSKSSTESSSGSSSGSSSSGSSSTSSGSGSSSSDSESSTSDIQPKTEPKSPKQGPSSEPKKEKECKPTKAAKSKNKSSSEVDRSKVPSPKPMPQKQRGGAKKKNAASVLAKKKPTAKAAGAKSGTAKAPNRIIKSESLSKKKSIFSPENSSDSEPESKNKAKTGSKAPTKAKKTQKKQTEEKNVSPSKTIEKPCSSSKDNEVSGKKKTNKSNTPQKLAKKVPENKNPQLCTSCPSSGDSGSSESEKEIEKKKDSAIAKPPKQDAQKPSTSREAAETVGTVPRKLTRSKTARASRMAKLNPSDSDTESDAEGKSTGKSKEDKKPTKARVALVKSPVIPSQPTVPSERKCPVRGCDSTGHLGGVADRHFTYDACPVYHNVTGPWCVAAAEERSAAATIGKKAKASMTHRPRAMPTIDQRAYQLKIKDLRSKWKGNDQRAKSNNEDYNEEREPVLDGFAPDYDLRLFRDAQALAAVKKEEGLDDIPTDKGTRYVVMGKYMMEVLYQSPYPGAAARVPRLFVCEFCLKHQACETGANRHRAKCVWRHPPGDEIYRKDSLSVWEVDGRKQKQYCQQLCLLAKFFLDHKTLYYDVEPFLFYVMTTADGEGCHIIGYFSKLAEKNSFLNYNVSCILTLPPYQRQGYGRLLIDFSYLLTKEEGKVGSPETPLSDLGLISYRSYWREVILNQLCIAEGPALSIRDLSKNLGIASSDIVSTLQERGLMKYWKGKHIVLSKEEVLKEAYLRAAGARSVDPSCLRWWGRPAPR